MSNLSSVMNRSRTRIVLAALAVTALAAALSLANAGRPTETVGAAATTEAAASRAYRDPTTGRLIPRALPGEGDPFTAEMPERLSRFQADLVEEPLAEGGFKVDLRGRFRSETRVHLDENGELHFDCVDPEHAPTERPEIAEDSETVKEVPGDELAWTATATGSGESR